MSSIVYLWSNTEKSTIDNGSNTDRSHMYTWERSHDNLLEVKTSSSLERYLSGSVTANVEG